MLEELVKQALIGTNRAGDAKPHIPSQLEAALSTLPKRSPEQSLLQAIAICGIYQRCGRKPAAIDAPLDVCSSDALPVCSNRAAQILDQLLCSADNRSNQQLIGEWLRCAIAAQQRAAHQSLPRLLDYGAAHGSSRSSISKVIDARGEWLMRQNPRWQFAATAVDDPTAIWETGNSEQRLSALRQLRQSDPARARALIESTWNEDQADDRAAFVEAMTIGLSDADEPMLERALDGKSKRVRGAAADLLTGLPQSAFVKRMVERAATLLRFVPGEAARLLRLKKPKPAVIAVTLPPESLDPSWIRDGITEKPDEKMGMRQWWLLQVVSYVPPNTWTTRWNVSPQECIEAADEYADVLLRAWRLAARRSADQGWLRTLLLAATGSNISQSDLELLNILDPQDQLELVAHILARPQTDLDQIGLLLRASHCALDRATAMQAVDKIEYHLSSAGGTYQYHLPEVLQNLALRIPPEIHDGLVTRWRDEKWDANRRSLDEFFAVLALRRDIKREFTK